MMKARLVVLVSGSGSNLQALIKGCAEGVLSAEIVLVVSNNPDAYGLIRAQNAHIPARALPHAHQKRTQYDASLADLVASYAPDLIILAGWMRILTPTFLDRFPRQVINLHPALPTQFDGTEAIQRAFAAYQRGEIAHSGCMVHYAIPQVDAGEVIAQTVVPIFPDDQLEQFEARMHSAEHQLLIHAVQLCLTASP